MDDFDEFFPTISPALSEQPLPEDDMLNEMTLEELEEELVRLTRQCEDLLAVGKVAQARDLEDRMCEIEDIISDLEYD